MTTRNFSTPGSPLKSIDLRGTSLFLLTVVSPVFLSMRMNLSMLHSRQLVAKIMWIHCISHDDVDCSVERVSRKMMEKQQQRVEEERQIRLDRMFADAWAEISVPASRESTPTPRRCQEMSSSSSRDDYPSSPDAQSITSSTSPFKPWPPRRACTLVPFLINLI